MRYDIQKALENNGYSSKKEYFEYLADTYDAPLHIVKMIADLLGDDELFDGLVSELDDGMWRELL